MSNYEIVMNLITSTFVSLFSACISRSMSFNICVMLSRMQSQAVELNGKIEIVNRERKYHQVILIAISKLHFVLLVHLQFGGCQYTSFVIEQQNAAYELNALSGQWSELCAKNIEIEAACAKIANYIEELNKEATERYLLFPA